MPHREAIRRRYGLAGHNDKAMLNAGMTKTGRAGNAWRRRPLGCDPRLRRWLIDRGSLTQRVQSRCRKFAIKLLRQRFALPCRDERAAVRLRGNEFCLVREVSLRCGRAAVVFAHSVIARRNTRSAWRLVTTLGNKSLGAALFADARVKRQGLEFRSLRRADALYQRAFRSTNDPPLRLWARRSLFVLRGARILVTEVFLPAILALAP